MCICIWETPDLYINALTALIENKEISRWLKDNKRISQCLIPSLQANQHLIVGKLASQIQILMYGIHLSDKLFQFVQSSPKFLPKCAIKDKNFQLIQLGPQPL